MPEPQLHEVQTFPVIYEDNAPFLDGAGAPSGAAGAIARLTVELNNNPHELIGVRISNVYDILPIPVIEVDEGQDSAIAIDPCCIFDRIDGQQTVRMELAQQNVVIEPTLQTNVVGFMGIHWHPLPCTYPFRGGNNLRFEIRRLTAYPDGVEPVCHIAVVGVMKVSDLWPPKGPPSTGFPVTHGR